MDKKRKNDSPTPALERGGEYERKEGRKRIRKTKAEDLNVLSKGTDGRDKQLQDSTLEEADHSGGNVKAKIRPGAKRTKKPPKSLENFICRPAVRLFQRPGAVVGHSFCRRGDGTSAKTRGSNQLCHSVQKKCNTDSLVTKENSTMTSTDPSPLSPSSLMPSSIMSPDSATTMTAKKVLPKLTKRTDLKSDLTLQETPDAILPQPSSKLSLPHKMTRNTRIKPTYPPKTPPASNFTSQQDSSPQQGINILNEDMMQQGQASPNSSHGNLSETSLYTVSCNRKSMSPKPTSSLQKNLSKYNENNSEMSSSLHLSKKEGEGCVEDLVNPNHGDVRTITNEKSKHQNGSIQEPSPCANDLPDHLTSFQVTDSSSSRKCTEPTSDLSGYIKGSKGQNENKDLNWTSEMTMKSSPKNSVAEQKKDKSINESADDEEGRRVKHCPNQEQIEANCLIDTNDSVGSTLNPQVSPAPVKPLIDGSSSNLKQDKKTSKKQKVRCLRGNKTAKMTDEINHSPVTCTVLQAGSQNETPFLSSSESLSSPQSEQNPVGQPPKLKPSQNPTNISEIPSLNKPLSRKRGRPKINKLGVPLQGKNSQVSFVNPPNDQNTDDPDPELDVKQTKPTARKRGRPKQSSSIQAQELISKKRDAGDLHMTSKDKARDIQKCKKSKKVAMKTIIRKINKMRVKRRDQVLTQILIGQKQCDSGDIAQEGTEIDVSSPVSPATHSLSSLVSSFGGKLGSQINVSKKGTIYMGKRRGRKPKYQTTSNTACKQISSLKSQQMLSDTPQFTAKSTLMQPSLDTQSIPGPSCTLKNIASSSSPGRSSQIHFNSPKIKATSFKQLSELQNSQAHCEVTSTCNSGEGINDNATSDRSERNNRLDEGTGFCSTSATCSAFTMSGVPGSNSFRGRPKALSSLSLEHLFSAHLPLGSDRTQVSSPSLTFTDQEAHKFKCHRKGHHCLSREKLRRHKYKCKKKYMQLRAKRQDPDFLADIEDLVVRLSKIHIVQHTTRTRLGDDASTAGRKTVKGKSPMDYDPQCLQEKVHPSTMFQINLSGYYSPHSALSYEPLHYVRMGRKHGCSSEPSEQIVTHFPVMHKLGYPLPGGGFIHPSYKVPFTTTSLGFGLYRGYPSTTTLYPLPFPPSYVQHCSKNPIISPSKFHKKRTKFPRQDSAVWGQRSHGTYPRMTPHSSCDCFNTESGQKEKQKPKERGRERRDKHSMMTERQHGNDGCLWLNTPTKDNENSGDCSFNTPSSSSSSSSPSVFSQIQNKDKSIHFTHLNPPNLNQVGEVRWSEHQPPWGLSNRNLNQDFKSTDHENTLNGAETDGNSASPQQSRRRTHSFLNQPELFSSTPSQKRITKSRKSDGVTGVSNVLKKQAETSVQELSSGDKRAAGFDQAGGLHLPRKHQCNDSSSSREPGKTQREPRGHKANRRPLIRDEADQVCQNSPYLRDEQSHPTARNTTSTRTKVQQHFKSPKHQNSEGLEVTAANEVKRRGPGRPRKNPKLSSLPSLPCVPELSSCLTEEKEKTGKEEKDNSDTVLEVIELVIHGEQRSGKKRKIDERAGDRGQKQNEEKDGAEKSSDFHMCPAPIGPSPSQVEDSQTEKASASLPKKKYLWAGLYSDVYKTEDIPDQPQQLSFDGLEYNSEEHKYGLLPAPLHVGKYLRLKRIDFQLPYDIHWLRAHNKLFEKPVTPPQAATSNSSCNSRNSSGPQSCTDDCLHTTLSDDENQTNGTGDENQQCHQLLEQQEENCDSENFPSPLSSEERSFVMKHGVFLVRNYEKMKARQALLLREGARELEKEKEEDKASGQSEDGDFGEDPPIKSDRCQIERRSCSEDEEHITYQSRNLTQTLQEIWDRIVSFRGSSGQTLSDPLINLGSRKRSDSALVDLSMVQKQFLSGQYESLEAFHSDMLIVFLCAEKYYGSDSAVGRDVSQLRAMYHRAHREASAHISNFL